MIFVSFQSTTNSLLAPSYTLLETMFPSLGEGGGGGGGGKVLPQECYPVY